MVRVWKTAFLHVDGWEMLDLNLCVLRAVSQVLGLLCWEWDLNQGLACMSCMGCGVLVACALCLVYTIV